MSLKTSLSLPTELKQNVFNLEFHNAVRYAQILIKKKSVTPDDAGCQVWLAQKLKKIGFSIDLYEQNGVLNLIAYRGRKNKCFAFAGHTDVVPANEPELWSTPPYEANIKNGVLFGRGSVDMKTALAAMLAAMEDVLAEGYQPKTQWQFLLTSDEEGEAEYGTKTIVSKLIEQNMIPDYCLVGEPTSEIQTGDVIKVGRRGSISGELTVRGKQGHVAYAGVSRNAIHLASEIIYAIEHIEWDEGSEDLPGTTVQVTYINSGDFTDNIVPGKCEICFNVRFSHRYDLNDIKDKIMAKIQSLQISEQCLRNLSIEWNRYCSPYFICDTEHDSFVSIAETAINQIMGGVPRLSTSGGTSDGRFISSDKTQVLELGLPNKTIHQVNEHTKLTDIYQLYLIYKKILQCF